MQPILNHLDNIVRPAVRDYVAAESALDAAHIAKDANAIDAARKNVMRRARIATTELHHLQDFVLHNPQSGLSFARIEDIRSALRAACVFGRGTVAVGDTDLLRDTADAFKHHLMTRQNSAVSGAAAIISISNGYGEMRFGEQKWSGIEQVTVTCKNGHKYSLLYIIQNSFDAWMKVLSQPELPMGQY
jgi:hypothetical protein